MRYQWTQFAIVTSQAPGYREFIDTMETLAAHSRQEAMVTISGNGKKGFTVLQEVLTRNTSNTVALKLYVCENGYSEYSGNGGHSGIDWQRLSLDLDPVPPRYPCPAGASLRFDSNGTLQHTELQIINLQGSDNSTSSRQWREVGRWIRTGLNMNEIVWPGKSSSPPSGKPVRSFLRVATLDERPYVMYEKPDPDNKCTEHASVTMELFALRRCRLSNTTVPMCCIGLSVDLLRVFSRELNFDFDFFEVEDGMWGAINKSTEPFDITSWILILMLCIHTVALGVYLFEWLSPDGLDRGDKAEGSERRIASLRLSAAIYFLLFCRRFLHHLVFDESAFRTSVRFLANIWALFAVVFLASYTANLAAFMITKEEFYDLSGIQDWRLQKPTQMNPPFKYATVPQGSTETNIRYNHPSMYHYMRPFNKPSVELGIGAVKSGEIQAFIYDATVLEYYTGKDPGCRLRTVGNWYAMTGYGVGFPPGADNTWVERINKVIFELQRNGEMERLQKFWLAGACYTEKEKKGISNKTLGILNFTSAFILLGGGVLLSVVLLLVEHIYYRFGRKCLMKMDSGCCSFVSLSVGKSLAQGHTEEARARRKRCQDRLCDTQIWRLRHELDLASLKIESLQNQINRGHESDKSSPHEDRTQQKEDSLNRKQPCYDFSQHNGSARRHTLQDASAITSSAPHLLGQESSDTRSECGDAVARLRRSPSYTSAIGDDVCGDDQKLSQKSRYHDGKIYVGVKCTSDKDSIL
ncbi:hypothetical protein C0Q70_01850 [Pomacea canaliculata]|uniref:Ionotropic glutamate receptor C-terminal domain-containing protein n=1 Tax=Pomacea canaliculata TaxID=400727 RepID=A0A2T7Q0L9_POMCA|nr:hypothetical protein C0Q70_01850 [Pomacea canaliculata]